LKIIWWPMKPYIHGIPTFTSKAELVKLAFENESILKHGMSTLRLMDDTDRILDSLQTNFDAIFPHLSPRLKHALLQKDEIDKYIQLSLQYRVISVGVLNAVGTEQEMKRSTTVNRTNAIITAAKNNDLGQDNLLIQQELFSVVLTEHFGVAELLTSMKPLVQLGTYCCALLVRRIQQAFTFRDRIPNVSLAMTERAMGCLELEDQQMISDLSYQQLGLSTHYYNACITGKLVAAVAYRIGCDETTLQNALDESLGDSSLRDRTQRRASGKAKREAKMKSDQDRLSARIAAAEAKKRQQIEELEKFLESVKVADEMFKDVAYKLRLENAMRKLSDCSSSFLDDATTKTTDVNEVINSIEVGNNVNKIQKDFSPIAFTQRLPAELAMKCGGCKVLMGHRKNQTGNLSHVLGFPTKGL
jgi:hypothetical protein